MAPGYSYRLIRPIRNNPGLIPDRTQNLIYNVIWDDGVRMDMMFEASMDVDGVEYPKHLASTPTRNDLGYYLRNRMKLFQNGTLYSGTITLQDFINYGTTGVELTLRGGQYYAKFR